MMTSRRMRNGATILTGQNEKTAAGIKDGHKKAQTLRHKAFSFLHVVHRVGFEPTTPIFRVLKTTLRINALAGIRRKSKSCDSGGSGISPLLAG